MTHGWCKASRRKTLFLDIDGVFNPVYSLNEPRVVVPHSWGTWAVSEANVRFLESLVSREDVELVWVSSWGDESNELNDYLGLPRFPVVCAGSKPDTLRRVLCEGSSFRKSRGNHSGSGSRSRLGSRVSKCFKDGGSCFVIDDECLNAVREMDGSATAGNIDCDAGNVVVLGSGERRLPSFNILVPDVLRGLGPSGRQVVREWLGEK